MKEDEHVYIFVCFRYNSAILRKENYKKHEPYHEEIRGPKGLAAIEDTLTNPDVVTAYSDKNALGQVIKKTEVFYKKLAKRKTIVGKPILDYWKAIIVWNEYFKQWEVATAFIKSTPPYAMINNRIESVVYKR